MHNYAAFDGNDCVFAVVGVERSGKLVGIPQSAQLCRNSTIVLHRSTIVRNCAVGALLCTIVLPLSGHACVWKRLKLES